MRRTVRPFIKEFKARSSKSTARPAAPADVDFAPARPAAERGDLAQRHNGHDDAYEAALRAADAVFGKPPLAAAAPAAAISTEAAQPQIPTGRVLPSLIEAPAVDRREGAEKAKKPRAPRGKKPKARELVRRKRRARRPEAEAEAPKQPIERPEPKTTAETSAPTALRRTQRPIQARWVFRTELAAGEKWKRRLPEAARRPRSFAFAKTRARRRGEASS